MPNEYNEDCMPRNAPIPAPLIEVPVKPLVPEVSLLFDQDKSRSFHITVSPEENKQKGKGEYNLENPQSIFPQNQLESYNSWKAKNAQVLHTITGSLNRSESKKQITGSIMPSDSRNKHTRPNEVYSGANPTISPPVYRHQVSRTTYTDQIRVGANCQSQGSDEFTHRQIARPTFNQRHNVLENNPLYRHYPQNDSNLEYRDNEENTQLKNVLNAHYSHEKNTHSALPLVTHNPYISKKVYSIPNTHVSHEPAINVQEKGFHEHNSYQNCQGYCECRQENNVVGFKNRIESDIGREENRAYHKSHQCKDSEAVSPLDIAKINNQTVMDLYKIINLQNEQILMLQQQVKQVLQIHLECDRKVVHEKTSCHDCPCEQKHNRNLKNDSNKQDCSCNEPENFIKHKASCSTFVKNKTPKRSVGIMATPPTDDFDENSGTDSNDSNDRKKANKLTTSQKLRQKQKKKSSSKNFKKRPEHEEKKGKAQYVSPNEKKKGRDGCKMNSSQVDNSFSLNEAELVIKTDPEQDSGTNQSVHIDLQDYCSSSDSDNGESVTSQSCEDQESATEEGSSDPQLGWTFYDRVVGQVNNILKKKRTPPRQEQSRGVARKPPPNYIFDRRGDFDVENNWSKRVTFDGPPLEDPNMMGNFMHARQYHQSSPYHNYRRGHDYPRPPGNPERMQDFMMYNYANGYSNLSFSTLRFLDRNDLLPTPMQLNWQDQQMLQDQQKSMKHNKTRNKPRAKELPSRGLQPKPNHKRKTVVDPSSKLLDITALKQQPKLF